MSNRRVKDRVALAAAALALLLALGGLVVAVLSAPTLVIQRGPDGELSASSAKRPKVWTVLQFDNDSATVCTAVLRDDATGEELARWLVGPNQRVKVRLTVAGGVQVECAEMPEKTVTVVIPPKPIIRIGQGKPTEGPSGGSSTAAPSTIVAPTDPPATVIVIGGTDERPTSTPKKATDPPPTDTVPAPRIAFSTDKQAVRPGDCAMLSWSTANISRVFLDGDGKPGEGTQRVCPTRETRYELRVELRTGRTERRHVTVGVLPSEATMSFRAVPDQVAAGDCAELQWNTENIDRVYLDGRGEVGNGKKRVCPASDSQHELAVHLRDGTVRRLGATIKVVRSTHSISFGADRTSLRQGECTTLRWNVEGIDSVYFDGGGVTGSGSRQVCPSRTTTYSLRVRLIGGGEDVRGVTITIAPTPTPWPTATAQATPTPTSWWPTNTPYPTATPCRVGPYPGYPWPCP